MLGRGGGHSLVGRAALQALAWHPAGVSSYIMQSPSFHEHHIMTANSEFSVQVVDDEIIVTLPGSHYSVTYYKSAKSPRLLAKFISDRESARCNEAVRVPCSRLEARQRQGERTWLGLGRVRVGLDASTRCRLRIARLSGLLPKWRERGIEHRVRGSPYTLHT